MFKEWYSFYIVSRRDNAKLPIRSILFLLMIQENFGSREFKRSDIDIAGMTYPNKSYFTQYLMSLGYIEKPSYRSYRLTEEGLRFVRKFKRQYEERLLDFRWK